MRNWHYAIAPHIGALAATMSATQSISSIRKSLGTIGLILLWFAVFFIPLVQITTCTQGEEDAWLVSLLFYLPASLVFLCLAFIGASRPAGIRWFSLPLFGLVPWAGVVAGRFTYGVTFVGDHLCTVSTGESGFSSYPSAWWSGFWGPVQLIFLALVVWCMYKYWVPSKTANKALKSQVSPAGTPQSGGP
jgi:hypothetical protein